MIGLIANVDYRLSVETATLILAIVGVILVALATTTITTMMHRQRRDLNSNRALAKALVQLSLQLEAEERKTRHAVKNLTSILKNILLLVPELPVEPDFTSIVESLEEPPDFLASRPVAEPGGLIQALVDELKEEVVLD